ncbi:hypothetical protein [Sphingomonas sp. AAP5]|uniref:hypothetical protein n=1 Tax=Sphingomonas sp. AAP5 TaxID=1523415 RepID=UPI0019CFA3B2|nr:hypothetical protein [Sphingomonas sp. AAP5]
MIHRYPECLPIAEIDPLFVDAISICTELVTPAGSIDNLLITAGGLPILVECKLWRNPEGRREVVGQILDYSKELTRWSASDLQREVSRRLGRPGNALLDLLAEAGHVIDEMSFNDALTHNLRRGRFLLLIVGDGIREGVEAIAEYLQAHAGLHFTFGLVEMPIYATLDGSRIVVPRVLARTLTITRTVIAIADGYGLEEIEAHGEVTQAVPETPERRQARERGNAVRYGFWAKFLGGLRLDDPEQMLPTPSLGGHVVFKFGAPGGSSWLTAYRNVKTNVVGVFLSGNRNSIGEQAALALSEQAEGIREELGSGATVEFQDGGYNISERFSVASFDEAAGLEDAIAWLQERTNTFVNVLRPRIRAALREIADQ